VLLELAGAPEGAHGCGPRRLGPLQLEAKPLLVGPRHQPEFFRNLLPFLPAGTAEGPPHLFCLAFLGEERWLFAVVPLLLIRGDSTQVTLDSDELAVIRPGDRHSASSWLKWETTQGTSISLSWLLRRAPERCLTASAPARRQGTSVAAAVPSRTSRSAGRGGQLPAPVGTRLPAWVRQSRFGGPPLARTHGERHHETAPLARTFGRKLPAYESKRSKQITIEHFESRKEISSGHDDIVYETVLLCLLKVSEADTVIQNDGQAVFGNLQAFGAVTGCFQHDCQVTDKLAVSSIEACPQLCLSLPECRYWVWGREDRAACRPRRRT
ncbi:unnamed protein product, partial [Prorocentrum cordatum]